MRSILVNISATDDQQHTNEYPFDPNMLPNDSNLISRLKDPAKQAVYADFLARKIIRHPANLLLHTQRIYLNYLLKNEDAYFGAVVDLFISLGSKGLDLKKSVLKSTFNLLTKEHAIFLKAHLRSGINSTQLIPTRESRLSRGISSFFAIIIEKSNGNPANDPLSSGSDKLADGVRSGRQFLENALEDNSNDLEITRELLELYRQNNLQTAFAGLTTQLSLIEKTIATQKKWGRAGAYFSQN